MMPTQVKQFGFTLIELVSVVILLGIVSVVVFPKFASRDDYSSYALRDQLISSFRYAQQHAMYDHTSGNCYSLHIDGNGFSAALGANVIGPTGRIEFAGDYEGVSVEDVAAGTPAESIFFDGLGNAFSNTCGGLAVGNPLVLRVDPSGIELEIYPTGFIRPI